MEPVEQVIPPERPDSFWKRVYIAVGITTVVVITLLFAFSKYFS